MLLAGTLTTTLSPNCTVVQEYDVPVCNTKPYLWL